MVDLRDGKVVQINANGTYIRDVVGVARAVGIVTNPTNGHLLVTGFDGTGPYFRDAIYDVDPGAGTSNLFVTGVPGADGIVTDGHMVYVAAAEASSGGHILGYDLATKTQVFDSGPVNGVDGTALGAGSLAGKIFANTNLGEVWEIDLVNPSNRTLIASGGSRGDFVAVDPNDNTLLVTQSDAIVRLVAPPGGASSPTRRTPRRW
jgi:hypothetical protein